MIDALTWKLYAVFSTTELKLLKSNGKEVVRHGLSNGSPIMVSAKRVERYFSVQTKWCGKLSI